MSKGSCIHWFRKGLRLTDNPALMASLQSHQGNILELRPVYILDPWFVKHGKVGDNRWRFLAQSLEDLDQQLKKLGSRLFVIKGAPKEVFPEIFEKWNVKRLTFEQDTEPFSVKRDAEITAMAEKMNVEVVSKLGHTLFDPQRVLKANKGQTPTTYQKFTSIASALGKPNKPLDAPSKENFPKEAKIANEKDLKDSTYNVPTLKEFGLDESKLYPCKFPGGETEGLKRMNDKFSNGSWVRSFEKPQTYPNSLEPSTTVLSPYLKFGCVSCRDMYYRLLEINSKGKHSQPPVSLLGQLYWREFFYTCGATIDNFDQMVGNKICRQIPWREDKEEYLKAWKKGRTGYPFIDAIMTQLRKEGWIHHLARHAVACFLTRGDLWVSWEEGQAVFEELLLDADWSLNAGNWMWLSASAFFHQYYRVYSPVAFGKKTDPLGNYIRKYVPKLAKFPKEYIYEPWKAPLSVQKGCGCIIGQDYPKPIVDHDVIHKENMGKMKSAYANGKVENGKADSGAKKETKKEAPKRKNESQSNKISKYMKK